MTEDPHVPNIEIPAAAAKPRRAGLWIGVLYFAEGFPYTVVNLMSVAFLKSIGASNILIGLSSVLYLPWVFKGFWGPVVDVYSTKRRWIITCEIVCTGLFLLLAAGALTPSVTLLSFVIFAMIAFASATHDIAIDGFYLDGLDADRQALYSGWRSTTYKLSWMAGNGGLIFLAGYLADRHLIGTGSSGEKLYDIVSLNLFGQAFTFPAVPFGWSVAFGVAALVFLVITVFQFRYLPYPQAPARPDGTQAVRHPFLDSFRTYFTQDRIGWIVTYILIFRLGDAFMLKMAQPFLMDSPSAGGMNISTTQIGILYGTVGVGFLLGGGILGGYLVAKKGLKKCMWPTAFLQNGAIVLYWILAAAKPNLVWVYVVNSFEQFSYGLGVAAYTVFLMRTVRPEYRASHYAISTAFMAAGIVLPGLVSGYLQTWMGYQSFFLMSFIVALPGLATIHFLPLEDKKVHV